LVRELNYEESDEAEWPQPNSRQILRLFRLGTQRFALFAQDVVAVANWRQPTPLPGAPEAILGIVSVQARMITVLDTSKLLDDQTTDELVTPNSVVVLTGQEQLGLTITSEDTALEISLPEIEIDSNRHGRPLLGHVRKEAEKLQILDPLQLFSAAIRGKERRRRQR
jgi:purine-binding chemotaxis protein CheW